jgi:hypothetical protein
LLGESHRQRGFGSELAPCAAEIKLEIKFEIKVGGGFEGAGAGRATASKGTSRRVDGQGRGREFGRQGALKGV